MSTSPALSLAVVEQIAALAERMSGPLISREWARGFGEECARLALQAAIEAIAKLPEARSDCGDTPWEVGAADGRQDAIDVLRTGRINQDRW